MAEAVQVEYIGWEDDFRYAEEKSRITQHIQNIAHDKNFAHACVQDMIMRYRYRSQGPFIDVHFKCEEWVTAGLERYVPIRLWFNEDGDLEKDAEVYDEVDKSK
ncbi:hypothetical protein TrVFT333_001477 [Trichoderma virens FT-333]|nr:hypothetical protein TrVFT333_001477 [Trichoderma virens FT-333]